MSRTMANIRFQGNPVFVMCYMAYSTKRAIYLWTISFPASMCGFFNDLWLTRANACMHAAIIIKLNIK